MNKVTTYKHQSPFDIAIQEYGSIEGVFDLLENNPGLEFDSAIAPGTSLAIGEAVNPEVVDYYRRNNIKPATGNIEDLTEYTNEDDGMIRRIYNYDLSNGSRNFEGVRLHNLAGECSFQINYQGLDAADVVVELQMSSDGVNWNDIRDDVFYALEPAKPYHTFMIYGLMTGYIRLVVNAGSATEGTIEKMIIKV